MNFGLTLGLAALAAPLVVRWRVLAPLLVCFIVLSLALVGMGLDGVLSRIDGMLLLLAFVAVVAFALARSRRETDEVRAVARRLHRNTRRPRAQRARLAISAVVLFYGAKWVVQSRRWSARRWAWHRC